MTKTHCLTADMLEAGARYRKTLSFSREQVALYCDLTGDRNAIHRDREAARLRFPDVPDIVVPGGLIQTTISGVFGTEWPGDGSIGLTFSPERFRKPICPGDEILVEFEITRIRGPFVEIEMTLDDAEGVRLTTAKAKILAPDAGYRAWWLQQQGG